LSKLDRLLKARSVAVVGGRDAATVVRQLKRIGFAGEIWPVNPNRAEIEGLTCYPSVTFLPSAPDIAFIAVPREAAIRTVHELRSIRSGGAVCYASGFGEIGADGEALEQDLIAAADGMPVFGPNCYGFINYLDRVAMWPDEHGGRPVERGAAIVTQSGNMGVNLTMQRRGLPLAGLYTLGNQGMVTMADMVAERAED
jgi:acetyl-CoA synthetase